MRKMRANIRAFLFVISEASRPKRFVNITGHSVKGKHLIPDSAGYFVIRKTYKATQACSKRDQSHYACLIEVFPERDSI